MAFRVLGEWMFEFVLCQPVLNLKERQEVPKHVFQWVSGAN